MAQKKTTSQGGTPDSRSRRPQIDVPIVGTVQMPSADRLAFYATLGVLGALEVIDWPVALVVGVGHLLSEQHHSRTLQEAGQAVESA
jgi:hypothetical protein